MSVLVIPNQFQPTTVAQSGLVNANFTAVATAVNNIDNTNIGILGIFASQLKGLSLANNTFGGAFGYTFAPGAAAQVPLTVSGTSGQSVHVFDVTLTSGGNPVFFIGSAGKAAFTAAAFSDPSAQLGDVVMQRGAASGALWLGGAGSSVTLDFGVTAAATLTVSKPTNVNALLGATQSRIFASVNASLSSSDPGGQNGDAVFQRSASSGSLFLGGAASSGWINYGITNIGGISLQTGAGGFAPVFGGAYTNSSDATLKQNIKTIPHGSEAIMALKPSVYQWIHDDSVGLGFLAQDVATVLPDLVSTDTNGLMGVNYDGIIPVLVKAFQELSASFQQYVSVHP